MSINEYNFVTVWKIEALLLDVWNTIMDVESFPDWWPAVKKLEILDQGDENGVNSLTKQTWQGVLPYRLSFVSKTTEINYLQSIVLVASGDLEGKGCWTFSQEDKIAIVRYDWQVKTTGMALGLLASIFKPLLAWNHDEIMRWGALGLGDRLGAKLIEY
jgi:hypothetical protein